MIAKYMLTKVTLEHNDDNHYVTGNTVPKNSCSWHQVLCKGIYDIRKKGA